MSEISMSGIRLVEPRTINVGVSSLTACLECGAVLFSNGESMEGPNINTVAQHAKWHEEQEQHLRDAIDEATA